MRAPAVHPEQLRLEPEQRRPGLHALAELDLAHAELVLHTEHLALRALGHARPCRCPRPAGDMAERRCVWCGKEVGP